MEIDYIELGKRVARKRKLLNLTQEKLAEKTGFSNNHISNIENNHTIASIDTILKIAIALNTTPDYLLLGITKSKNADILETLNQRAGLCNERQLALLSNFLDWVIEQEI